MKTMGAAAHDTRMHEAWTREVARLREAAPVLPAPVCSAVRTVLISLTADADSDRVTRQDARTLLAALNVAEPERGTT